MLDPTSGDFDVIIVGGGSAGCAAAWRLVATTQLRVPRANANLTCTLIGMKVADAVAETLVS